MGGLVVHHNQSSAGTKEGAPLLKFIPVFALVFVLALPLLAQGASAPLSPIRWELHGKIGTQRYHNEMSPHPGTAPMYGSLLGYRFSERSLIGVSVALAAYEFSFFGATFEEEVASILLLYRRYWRVDQRFQPYVDSGGGWSDPVLGYDSGAKGAFTVAIGVIWRPSPRWGVAVENRGGAWLQDGAFLFKGDTITVGSSELSLGLYWSH